MCGNKEVSGEKTMNFERDIAFLRALAENGRRPVCRCELVEQGWGTLARGMNLLRNSALKVGETEYAHGFGTHSPSRIRVVSVEPLRHFCATAGIERNPVTDASPQRIAPAVFSVRTAEGVLASRCVRYADGGVPVEADLKGAAEFELAVEAPGGSDLSHVDWCAPEVETLSGERIPLGTPKFDIGADTLPLDFRFNGMKAVEFLRRWGVERRREEFGDHTLFTVTSGGAEAGLRLEVTMKLFRELPVLEYHVAFRNPAERRSPRLSEVDSLRLSAYAPEPLRLRRQHGSFQLPGIPDFSRAFCKSFTHEENLLDSSSAGGIRFGATGGRPSAEWLPCFDLTDGRSNLRAAVGWGGQWHAGIVPDASTQTVEIRAGMEKTGLELEPGEEIELPSVALVWNEDGGSESGVNVWRRFLREKIMPRPDGNMVDVPVSCITWGGMKEAEHLARIANVAERRMPFGLYWIDAGWYGTPGANCGNEFDAGWSSMTGNWEFNPEILPEKLRNISAASHAAGMKQSLWIEPERAMKDSRICREHPEYFLACSSDENSRLLNLGNPQAWQWCFDMLSRLIEDNALDWLRIDYNISPLPFWRENDAPGRSGFSEISCVAGFYRLWKALREKFPRLLIDNCASGGRRLDFESLRYSIPLWGCDMQCADGFDPEWQLAHMAGLSHYLPAFSFGVQNQDGGDTYNFRASMGPGIVVHYFTYSSRPVTPDWPHDWLKKRLAEYLRVKECFAGDYYCLEAFHAEIGMWTLMQFDRPDLGCGVLEAFRGVQSAYRTAEVRLKGLDPAAEYRMEDIAENSEPFCATGRQLMEHGVEVTLAEPRSSTLVSYRKKESDTP